MNYKGRFAPTPSGALHIGSLYAAVASFLDAKAHYGKWLLRIEDTDRIRSRIEFSNDILRILEAYGLHWDEEIRVQSQHLKDYSAALEKLPFYFCDCSRKKWQKNAQFGELGAIYPQNCRLLHKTEGAKRLPLINEVLSFEDRFFGTQTFDLTKLGDPILQRKDGNFAYLLAVVIDDYLQNITHIVRGADLLAATPIQIYLQRLLNFETPQYLHLPLILDATGQKLSKSKNAPAIDENSIRKNLLDVFCHLNFDVKLFAETQTKDLLKQAIFLWRELFKIN